ncbi:MAG TPA: HAMP domain-containing sensor histidine kinase [Spirochaetales bacterium]|mgnify:CR=1 FL=1|nr:HAMP domain-containing sensor histidine kinase [Spirochaetales bacterium]
MENIQEKEVGRILKSVYFFQDLQDSEIEALSKVCERKQYKQGEIVFQEESKADYFFIIIRGTVEVWKDYFEPQPDLLAVHDEGHLFGEMALVDDLPRSATVVAKTDLEVLRIFRDAFHAILERNGRVAISILKSLSAMIRKSNEYFVYGLRQRNVELQQANEELHLMQEELLKNERLTSLGKFSSMVLHDIRNPVSVIRSYGEMILLNLENDERIKKYASSILKETERLNLLLGELLDYSRGEIRLNLSIVELNQFFEKLKSYIATSLEGSHIELCIENQVTDPVLMDEERMLRVFINLTDNSRKAMSRGGTLRITTRQTDTHVGFLVEDTGQGMTKEVLANIFTPFYSFTKGGTGLGLVIAKNIVEAHEGTIHVESRLKKGTRVEIILPRRI